MYAMQVKESYYTFTNIVALQGCIGKWWIDGQVG